MEKTTKTTIIASANQKGGVGKTTSAVNIAAGLVKLGKKVLCIDFDPQTHLSKYLGHKYDGAPTISEFVIAKASCQPLPSQELLIRHSTWGIDYIPSSLKLSNAEMSLVLAMCREQVLKKVLDEIIPEGYDYVLIDCNPSMGILLINVLAAADRVLIPAQSEEFGLDGLEDMLNLIQTIKSNINPRLQIAGILPTFVKRTNDSREKISWLRKHYPELTFETQISRYEDAPKSATARKPLIGSKTILGEQYMAATHELLTRLEG